MALKLVSWITLLVVALIATNSKGCLTKSKDSQTVHQPKSVKDDVVQTVTNVSTSDEIHVALRDALEGKVTTNLPTPVPKSNSQVDVLHAQPFVFFGHNMVATTILLTFPPGDVGDTPHIHPGTVSGYVVEGEFLLRVNNGSSRILRAGQAFFEDDGDVHVWGANGSNTRMCKVVATLWLRAGEDMLTFVNRPRESRDDALKLAAQGR